MSIFTKLNKLVIIKFLLNGLETKFVKGQSIQFSQNVDPRDASSNQK